MRAFLVCALALTCSLSWAQRECQIKVFQNEKEVVSERPTAYFQRFRLKPEEFQIEVSPSACSPRIATIPDSATAGQIGATPLIYSWRADAIEDPRDSDKLLWFFHPFTDPEFRAPPSPDTFYGKQYLGLCAELKFCPTPYPTQSSPTPFVADPMGEHSTATFKRLDGIKTLAAAKGKKVLSVIYTLWRSMPSEYPATRDYDLLFRPNFVAIEFLDY